ncbi:hypothetical protein [Nocardioides zhouii]|uniref:Uncharacterized protein n=1 Tax=Nocardioides zhouii TaxID=1168729 RepID=A0A4Q2T6R3_9ACTN|nr:hypothetical protein [Nocardioides zhouii]RYC12509.1 hypothetical protein EUA94_07505 [Nocardioides zhouii]
MGDNMLMADIGLVANALTALNVDPDLVAEVTEMLLDNSDDLKSHIVTDVAPGWFGGSSNAHRIGVNTKMAHQAVEEEFQKLADSLRGYSEAINLWANEVRDVDGTSNAEMVQRQTALEQVNTTLDHARDESGDNNMGDGSYTEPTTSGSGA